MIDKSSFISKSYCKKHKQAHRFIDRDFYSCGYIHVFISQLNVRLAGSSQYINVKCTPHYIFVRNVLYGEAIVPINDYKDYKDYIKNHWHPCDEKKFIDLIYEIKEKGYECDKSPILVYRSIRRLWPLDRYDVVDGFHRLAILEAIGLRNIKVLRVKQRKNFYYRLLSRLKGFLHATIRN